MAVRITSDRFWSMTYAEVVEEINAYYKRRNDSEKRQQQIRAMMDYQLAQLIGTIVHNPKQYPKTLVEAYPDLFPHHDDWRASKASFAAYAAAFNQKRGVKH